MSFYLAVLRRSLVALLALSAAVALPARAQAQGQNAELRVGSLLALTGPAAFIGEDMKRGLELAVDDINASGGILGKQVKLYLYDSESDSAKGLSAIKRILNQDKVDAVVGGGTVSGVALAVRPIIEAAPKLFIATEGSMDIVNPVKDRRYTFKTTPDDTVLIGRALDYLKKKGISKIGLLYSTEALGQSAHTQMQTLGPAAQMQVVYEAFGPADTDLTPQLTNLKSAGVQAIICWTATPAGVVFLKQAHQLGMDNITLVHSNAFLGRRFMELAGPDATKNLVLVGPKFPVGGDLPASDPAKEKILSVIEKYKKRYGRDPDLFLAPTYDAMMLMASLMNKLGTTDAAKLGAAMESTSGFHGVSGTLSYSPQRHSGLAKEALVMIKWEGGRFRLADY